MEIKINYPFEFNELLLNDDVLDNIGFIEYHDECADFGSRSIILDTVYLIYDIDAVCLIYDSEESGYPPVYNSNHYTTSFFKTIYFLHELYENILETKTEKDLKIFTEKLIKCNMFSYIESWIRFKNNI